jgi:hypothetical protein
MKTILARCIVFVWSSYNELWRTVCKEWTTINAQLVGEGIASVDLIKNGKKVAPLYRAPFTNWLSLLNYTQSSSDWTDDISDTDLLYVRYVADGKFKEFLTRGDIVKTSWEELEEDIEDVPLVTPYTPCASFINGMNITDILMPLLSSFDGDADVTVRELISGWMALGRLSPSICDALILRQGDLELTMVDRDLDVHTFKNDEVIKWPPPGVVLEMPKTETENDEQEDDELGEIQPDPELDAMMQAMLTS